MTRKRETAQTINSCYYILLYQVQFLTSLDESTAECRHCMVGLPYITYDYNIAVSSSESPTINVSRLLEQQPFAALSTLPTDAQVMKNKFMFYPLICLGGRTILLYCPLGFSFLSSPVFLSRNTRVFPRCRLNGI